jgi:hypothetical protein
MAADTAGPEGAAKAVASAKDTLAHVWNPPKASAPSESKPAAPATTKDAPYQLARELRDKQENVEDYVAHAPKN